MIIDVHCHFGYETMGDKETYFFLSPVYWHVGPV